MSSGHIVQIIGAVIDVEFPRDSVPSVYDALLLEGGETTLEVQQQLGDGIVRTIAMGSTEGLKRGLPVTSTGAPIRVPVGNATLGRIMDVLGRPIDECGEIGEEERYEIHHGVRITDPATIAAATLSNRYIAGRQLPDKAIDVVDEAGARVRLRNMTPPPDLAEIESKIEKLQAEKDEHQADKLAAEAEKLAAGFDDVYAFDDASLDVPDAGRDGRVLQFLSRYNFIDHACLQCFLCSDRSTGQQKLLGFANTQFPGMYKVLDPGNTHKHSIILKSRIFAGNDKVHWPYKHQTPCN